MPRCFMAKKLKYPYQRWKENNQVTGDEEEEEDEGGGGGGGRGEPRWIPGDDNRIKVKGEDSRIIIIPYFLHTL